jgi:hypothetical protein
VTPGLDTEEELSAAIVKYAPVTGEERHAPQSEDGAERQRVATDRHPAG